MTSAAPELAAEHDVINPATAQLVTTVQLVGCTRLTMRSIVPLTRSSRGARWRRSIVVACLDGSLTQSTPPSKSWRSSRSRTQGTRSAMLDGRLATSAMC